MARSSPKRSPGKGTLVDTWIYDATYSTGGEGGDVGEGEGESEGVKRTRKVSVELRLIKDFDGDSESPPLATKSVRLTLSCKEIGLDIGGTDVEALRAAMWERLDARYNIKWESWLLVKVDPRSPYEGSGSGFVFSHQSVERGVAHDGSVLLREYKAYATPRQQISPWPQEFKEKGGRTLACIPASEGNLKALDEFARRIEAMRRQLAEFVKPDAILQTLANLQGHMALAGQAASAPRIAKAPASESDVDDE